MLVFAVEHAIERVVGIAFASRFEIGQNAGPPSGAGR